MPQFPFDIPKSLASYAEHFEEEPLKATTRLKKQLKKRGPDAVGHFLLAWFYHLKGMNDQAVDEALKARIFAPGSPFFEKLHYYLSHPQSFEAWTPSDAAKKSEKPQSSSHDRPGPVLDLDSLIQKLSKVESERIRPSAIENTKEKPVRKQADDVDDIVSETLASIHEAQGKIKAAIKTYRRLKELNKDKTEYYNEQILRLENIKEDKNREE